MKEVIEIGIPYNCDGEDLLKKMKIGFVSNEMIRRYNLLAIALSDAVTLQEEMNSKTSELADIIVNKKMSLSEKRKAAILIKDELKFLKKQIKEENNRDLLAERFDLIKLILEKNGCSDKDLLSLKWWDENTEPHVSWTFLQMSVIKDMSGAKKKVNMTLTKDS